LKRTLQIGITGGIGSGKSMVCRIFETLGISVYDADSHAKELMTTDGILVNEIKKEFGTLSYNPDGSLNRAYLARTVFNDEKRLATLNKLVHPRVGLDYKAWADQKKHQPYILKEAALLFESGTSQSLDAIIVVHANTELRINRVLKRDLHRTREQVLAIIAHQMPEEEKLKRADYVIRNDETTLLIPQVLKLHHVFSSLYKG